MAGLAVLFRGMLGKRQPCVGLRTDEIGALTVLWQVRVDYLIQVENSDDCQDLG